MFCPNCGQQIADDALFCGNCGTKIGASQAQDSYASNQYSQPAYEQPAYQQPAPTQEPRRQESGALSTWALLCSIIFSPIVGIILGIIGCIKTPSYRGKCIAAIVIGAVMWIIGMVISYTILLPMYTEMLSNLMG